jgi:hypothetical protein
MIQQFPFEPPIDNCPNMPFPDEITLDPWVLYHGTSGLSESQIDSKGLSCNTPTFEKREIEAVDAIFETLQWNGRTGASRAVLQPFSIVHDFGDSSLKPLCFAESAYRAMTYATRDFAGGEAARAIRYSFDELWEFVTDEEVRELHLQRLFRAAEDAKHFSVALPSPEIPDLVTIRGKLESLASLRARAQYFSKNHRYGVVCAVRFEPSDLDAMSYHGAMGIKCFDVVSPDRIIGKTHVPVDYDNPPFLSVNHLKLPPFKGIIKSLRQL